MMMMISRKMKSISSPLDSIPFSVEQNATHRMRCYRHFQSDRMLFVAFCLPLNEMQNCECEDIDGGNQRRWARNRTVHFVSEILVGSASNGDEKLPQTHRQPHWINIGTGVLKLVFDLRGIKNGTSLKFITGIRAFGYGDRMKLFFVLPSPRLPFHALLSPFLHLALTPAPLCALCIYVIVLRNEAVFHFLWSFATVAVVTDIGSAAEATIFTTIVSPWLMRSPRWSVCVCGCV